MQQKSNLNSAKNEYILIDDVERNCNFSPLLRDILPVLISHVLTVLSGFFSQRRLRGGSDAKGTVNFLRKPLTTILIDMLLTRFISAKHAYFFGD